MRYRSMDRFRLPDGSFPPLAGADGSTDEPAATEGTTTPPESEAPPAPKPEDTLGEGGKAALKAERDARKAAEKAARDALAKVKQYEDAQKTETERLTGDLTAATERAVTAERRLAALEAGLPVSMADRLRGSTAEELKADAEALKAELKIEDKPEGDDGDDNPASTAPPGSLDGGARPPAPKKTLQQQIAEASSAGDWERVNALNAQLLEQEFEKQRAG